MATGRRKERARREPLFDSAPPLGLRADPRDRPAGHENPRRTRRNDSSETRGRAKKAKRRGGARLRRAVYWSLVLGLWAVIAAMGAVIWIGAHLPPIQSLEIPKRAPSIVVTAADGSTLARRGDGGTPILLKDLPAYVPEAFIAIEDRRFYHHHGVDPVGILRAGVANILHRGVAQGGSTLTQQLAKNLFLTQERTFSRKLQEAALAIWLERKFSKAQILELYLNRVYFGAGAYGIEAAAERYFSKPAKQLSIAEAAMLAGLVKSPSRLAPTRNPDAAERRAQIVLAAMAEQGFVSEAKVKTALMDPAHAVKQAGGNASNYVADWITDVLDDLIGHVDQDVVIETSIDPVLQMTAEQSLRDELDKKGDKFGVSQGAIVSMSPDGTVRAMVGGRDYMASQFNRAVSAKRQPGSAFKPFVYLTAIERGLMPDTVRDDKPIALKGWRPENYGHRYHGPVTLTQALAMSLNTVAVRLTLEFGPTAVARTAYRLGIASKLDPNPSIALGTSEVSVIELVSAYAPFANGGFAVTPHVIERVRGADGKTLYRRKDQTIGRVIEPRYVGMMNQMMQETLHIGTAHAASLAGWPAAGKTGTSQDFRDSWFVGYTSQLVTGVWLGNDDNSPTKKSTGGGLPVDIWSRVMKAGHQGLAVAALPDVPGGIVPGGAVSRGVIPSGILRGLFGPAPQRPPAAVAARPVAAKRSGGIDGWFLDTLFGRGSSPPQ